MIERFLAAVGGLDADVIIRMLAAHAIPGVEFVDQSVGMTTRLISTSHGPVSVTVGVNDHGVTVRTETAAQNDAVEPVVRRWFDLDTELGPIWAALGTDPKLAPLITRHPRLRLLGQPEPFEAIITTVLGQQVSVAAARTFAGRLAAAYGAPGPAGLLIFPDADRLSEVDVDDLRSAVGITGSRARTVLAVSLACRAGHRPSRTELLALPGVGPWTVDYVALRVDGDADAFTPGDLVLRRAMGDVDQRTAARQAEAWRPYRAYAQFQLWISAAYS